MTERYFITAYWGARQESLEACTERLKNCLSSLAAVDNNFGQWYEPGLSRAASLKKKVLNTSEELIKILSKGVNRYDSNNQPIENLGFRVSLWNGGEEGNSIKLNILCGSFTNNIHIINSVKVVLPRNIHEFETLITAQKTVATLKALVEAWEADWGVAISREYQTRLNLDNFRTPFVGWALYLSCLQDQQLNLPASCRILPTNATGKIILLTNEQFTVSSEKHIRLAQAVKEELDKANLIRDC